MATGPGSSWPAVYPALSPAAAPLKQFTLQAVHPDSFWQPLPSPSPRQSLLSVSVGLSLLDLSHQGAPTECGLPGFSHSVPRCPGSPALWHIGALLLPGAEEGPPVCVFFLGHNDSLLTEIFSRGSGGQNLKSRCRQGWFPWLSERHPSHLFCSSWGPRYSWDAPPPLPWSRGPSPSVSLSSQGHLSLDLGLP